MKSRLVALTAGLLLLGAGNAAAAMPSAGQMAEQTAGNLQTANSTATSTQDNSSNSNISVRIHSPGNNGSVSQSNNSTANSTATNDNTTNQTTDQRQAGPNCCDDVIHRMLGSPKAGGGSSSQEAAQDAWNGQHADSNAVSTQYNPSNENISVRIHSPGSDGNVTQNNTSSATSTARNTNETTQDLSQSQSGSGSKCCGSGAGMQAGEQSAWNG